MSTDDAAGSVEPWLSVISPFPGQTWTVEGQLCDRTADAIGDGGAQVQNWPPGVVADLEGRVVTLGRSSWFCTSEIILDQNSRDLSHNDQTQRWQMSKLEFVLRGHHPVPDQDQNEGHR